jgi:hypothetical protein
MQLVFDQGTLRYLFFVNTNINFDAYVVPFAVHGVLSDVRATSLQTWGS